MVGNMRIVSSFNKILNCMVALLLVACQGLKIENDDADLLTKRQKRDEHIGKLFGEESIPVTGPAMTKTQEPGSSIAVNVYLWRSSLETVSFMPLKSVDPFGGVILTDWFTPDHTPNERLKVDILILDRELRVDGLKISVFRQKFENGHWIDLPVNQVTARQMEDTILTRARELKASAGR